MISVEEVIAAGYVLAGITVFLLVYIAFQRVMKWRVLMQSAKGFIVGSGYEGWVPWLNRYVLFPTEDEYLRYLKENQ